MRPITAIRRKHRLWCYAIEKGIALPAGFGPDAPVFGKAAVELLRRVQKHMGLPITGKWGVRKVGPRLPLAGLRIRGHRWSWNGSLGRRNGNPPGIAHHHTAGAASETVQSIHRYHRNVLKWRGIAYHIVGYQNGELHRGRPLWAMGGHARNHGHWIGLCVVGNYETQKQMPPRQMVALHFARCLVRRKYGTGLRDVGHGSLPDNSTACPGRHYPFKQITR